MTSARVFAVAYFLLSPRGLAKTNTNTNTNTNRSPCQRPSNAEIDSIPHYQIGQPALLQSQAT
jgi:hypothetical protein